MWWGVWPRRRALAACQYLANAGGRQPPSSNKQQCSDDGAHHMAQKTVGCQFYGDEPPPVMLAGPAGGMETVPHC